MLHFAAWCSNNNYNANVYEGKKTKNQTNTEIDRSYTDDCLCVCVAEYVCPCPFYVDSQMSIRLCFRSLAANKLRRERKNGTADGNEEEKEKDAQAAYTRITSNAIKMLIDEFRVECTVHTRTQTKTIFPVNIIGVQSRLLSRFTLLFSALWTVPLP